ncbi:MAG: hypothetical protein WCH77_12330 [Planctomycetota bacterium]
MVEDSSTMNVDFYEYNNSPLVLNGQMPSQKSLNFKLQDIICSIKIKNIIIDIEDNTIADPKYIRIIIDEEFLKV